MSYTMQDILGLLKSRYEPDELCQLLDLDTETLVDALADHVEENFEKVHQKILDDEMDHFGVYYGKENDS